MELESRKVKALIKLMEIKEEIFIYESSLSKSIDQEVGQGDLKVEGATTNVGTIDERKEGIRQIEQETKETMTEARETLDEAEDILNDVEKREEDLA